MRIASSGKNPSDKD
jgi:hypothetical protein